MSSVLFYFAPQNQSYQEEELETVTSMLFEFIYIFRLTHLTRILYILHVHHSVIQSIFMAVMKEMQSLHKRESLVGKVLSFTSSGCLISNRNYYSK